MEEFFVNLAKTSPIVGMSLYAVYLLWKSLGKANQDRIESLERQADVCEKDRIDIRKQLQDQSTQFTKLQQDVIESLLEKDE